MIKKILTPVLWIFIVVLFALQYVHAASNFWDILKWSVETEQAFEGNDPSGAGWVSKRLQEREITWWKWAWATVAELLWFVAIKVMMPIAILVWVIIAFIGFYKVMVGTTDDDLKKWNRYLLRWTIGVVLMVSTMYIVNTLVWTTDGGGSIIWDIFGASVGTPNVAGQQIAEQIYGKILFPFLKIFMFIIIGILFIILFINVIKYLFSPAEDIVKKALTIVIRSTVWIITIILAKYIVEAIFGKYDTIVWFDRFNTWQPGAGNENNLWKIGTPLGDILVDMDKLFLILNRLLWLLTLIILILILYQWFKLLFNPTSSASLADIGKRLMYIFIGILVLGFGYIIASAVIPV